MRADSNDSKPMCISCKIKKLFKFFYIEVNVNIHRCCSIALSVLSESLTLFKMMVHSNVLHVPHPAIYNVQSLVMTLVKELLQGDLRT